MLNKFKMMFSTVVLCAFFSLQAVAEVKVGLVLDRGGKDDRSFNAAAYKGAIEAKEKLGVFLKYVEASDDNAFEVLMRGFAQKKFDLVIAVGVAQKDAVEKVSKLFPDTKFALVDAEVNAPNVRSLLFEEHEGSYLVGYLAGLATATNKIGFIGGMDIPLIRRFEKGFEAGIKHANPKAKLISNFVGVTSEAWNNPPKGKELARSQYQAGADIIFSAAGNSGMGMMDAAQELQKFAIGVDSNQNWVRPGRVLTSMLKRVDVAVFQTVEDIVKKQFTGGQKRFGLANKGIDYAVDEHNKGLLKPEWLKKLEEVKAQIIAKKISVPDYYKMKK